MSLEPAPHAAVRRVVGIAELAVSDDPRVSFVTYALGSCVAVAAWAPARCAGGLIHFMLPLSKAMPKRSTDKPALFADTGVPLLFRRLYTLGCSKEELVVKVAGGGRLLGGSDELDVGSRNLEMLDYLFARSAVEVAARDVGGTVSRTVEFKLATGEVCVRSRGKERLL
ncbi:MAG: chemotaxis protein CheD [Myxococcaceae bacterium]|nr:chemotaxis protein CheD [Myxococcaceae bacterium]